MSDEEIDVLYNEILNSPKVERPIPVTTMGELNVNDLFDTIREFRKIPDYSDLLNENKRLKDQLKFAIKNNGKLQIERDMYKGSFETMSENYFRLENIKKEVREYIETKEKDDDNWVDYELLIEPIRIKEILDKENK